MPIVSIQQLTKDHRQGDLLVHALRGVDLAVEPGEFTTLMGPSGSGKTTLLNIAGGLDEATGGHVVVDGVDLATASAARTLVDAERWRFDLSGDLKTFSYAAFPFEWYVVPDDDLAAWGMEPEPLMPEDPLAMGALDLRLKAGIEIGSHLSLDAQARTGASYASQTLSAGAISLGTAGTGRDEAVQMSWQPVYAPDFGIEGRVDRLAARLSVPHLEVTLGRQPASFGSAWIFTAMDLVAPFSPTDIDTGYKPGVDAVRVDKNSPIGRTPGHGRR